MKTFRNQPLKPYHTFGTEAYAGEFIILETEDDVLDYVAADPPVHSLILGGGSNVLFIRNYIDRVVKIDLKGIDIIGERGDEVIVRAAAGEDWDHLVGFCVRNGWGGLENLSGIPGNTGSSPIQNIGAYGTELKDHFHSLEAIELASGSRLVYDTKGCRFGYRDSIFKRELKGRVIITGVTFRLNKVSRPNLTYQALAKEFREVPESGVTIQQVRDAVLRIRASKLPDPMIIGNAGSFFKNPVVGREKLEELRDKYPDVVYYRNEPALDFKLAAGWLIEMCGWKGYREGDAGIHKDQALVLVNYGNATGRQIYVLSERIKMTVLEKFDVALEREVNII